MTAFDEGTMTRAALGAWRQMSSSPGLTRPRPQPPAMSVRCTMTCPPDASGLFDPDCCFFVSADQPSRPQTEITRLKTDSLNSLWSSVSSLGQGVELSSGKNCLGGKTCRQALTVARGRGAHGRHSIPELLVTESDLP